MVSRGPSRASLCASPTRRPCAEVGHGNLGLSLRECPWSERMKQHGGDKDGPMDGLGLRTGSAITSSLSVNMD